MSDDAQVFGTAGKEVSGEAPRAAPCIYIIFGACGDVTRRLMMPAVYNLACDGLLPPQFAIIGADIIELSTEQYRERLSSDQDGIRKFHTRKQFDEKVWNDLRGRLHYVQARDLDGYRRLLELVKQLQAEYKTGDNIMFYFAVAPRFFGPISTNLVQAGFREGAGWRRIIVEKPFGTDLKSAQELNRELLAHWREDQIYRVDHYLGKETVQNLLAFRFANGMFEPIWNRDNIDHIEFTVSEAVDVESRGDYYDKSGVLRDMLQNHMFQMLAYLCMEPPANFQPDSIRNEKAKLLSSVRIYRKEEVAKYAVRGQYGPLLDDSGKVLKPGYRQEKGVPPDSNTETFAAVKLFIDNWRWEGVPIYLRSGKALWKRGTEIVVQFKKAPLAIFSGTPVEKLAANRLIFHIQPYQGIETLFQAKIPGPVLKLQNVHMRFSYGDTFKASRYTGYEVMVYSCMNGDATLFSRTDLVETAWKIAQPILDAWKETPVDFPNYTRGSWGPTEAYYLTERDGRRWYEVLTPEVLEQSPLFAGSDPLLLNAAIMALRPCAFKAGDYIVRKGDTAREMYYILRGQVEVVDDDTGKVLSNLRDGDFFGEIGLLLSKPRTASVRAKSLCDTFVLEADDFSRILREHPQFAERITRVAKERYSVTVSPDQLTGAG